MSRATKRKYVTKEVLEEFVEPCGKQEIVKVRRERERERERRGFG